MEKLLEPIELNEAELAAVAGGDNVNVGIVIGNANGAFSEQENIIITQVADTHLCRLIASRLARSGWGNSS